MYYQQRPKVGNARIKEKQREPRSVRDTIGCDPDRLWYPISNYYRGYEVSNDGYVRSCKILKKDFGCLIRPDKKNNYTLSNEEGIRVTIPLSELFKMANTNPFGSPRKTTVMDSGARNKRAFQHKTTQVKNAGIEGTHHTYFTVIPDPEPEQASYSIFTASITCPIYDITGGGVYYGRTEEENERYRKERHYKDS